MLKLSKKKKKGKKKKIQRRLSISRRVDLLIPRLKAINMYWFDSQKYIYIYIYVCVFIFLIIKYLIKKYMN